ncbi:hypothetical protein LguiA_015390 [Lonicera macranthoides]
MTTGTSNQLINVMPEELKFQFELEKQSYSDLKVSNNTENHVAFKVKTTSPKKYFVRPNTGIIKPRDSTIIRVTLQAQREYPPDMQCKDKFLLQSTIVPANIPIDELPQDTFNKDSGKTVEECKLRVVYVPHSTEDNFKQSFDTNSRRRTASFDDNEVLMRLKDERDAAVKQAQQVQQDLEMMKRRRNRKSGSGFSFKFALLVALIGIVGGFLLKLYLSSPSTA